MKNLIFNNCLGGGMFTIRHEQFPNPFIWARLFIDDFIYLVNNYETINLNNVEFSLEHYWVEFPERTTVKCTIDGKVNLHFSHYVQDESYDKPTHTGNGNTAYADILAFAIEKWNERYDRMEGDPIFIYSLNGKEVNSDFYINEFNRLITEVQVPIIILVTEGFIYDKDAVPSHIKVLEGTDNFNSFNSQQAAKDIEQKLYEYIDSIH